MMVGFPIFSRTIDNQFQIRVVGSNEKTCVCFLIHGAQKASGRNSGKHSVTSTPTNTNKLSTIRLFLWPWDQVMWQSSDPLHPTEQLYSSTSLQTVPGPLCPPNHGPALPSEGLFGLDQNHANTSTAYVTVGLQDNTQSLPGPLLAHFCRCSHWDE